MIVNGMEEKGLIKVDNARVYGLNESFIASKYPKALEPVNMEEESAVDVLQFKSYTKHIHTECNVDPDYLRVAKYLGKAKPGSGHDCYLKGILVQFDLCVPEYIWRQLNRYHFIDFVSSQSKMHKILQLDIDEQCNKYVTRSTIQQIKKYIDIYNDIDSGKYTGVSHIELRNGEKVILDKTNLFNVILANMPCGLMLTARMTTNYLQLKTIIEQRENHKMPEWRYLTDWFKTLPLLETITQKEKRGI